MKHLVLLLIFFILYSVEITGQNYWIKTSSPTTHQLLKFVFTDIQNGWAAGDTGIIIHTSNGGINWVIQNSTFTTDDFIRDIFF